MIEYLGLLISYTCQVAIILFVLNEFGWIQIQKKDVESQQSTSSSKDSKNEKNPFSNLMESMAPMVQGMMKNMNPDGLPPKSFDTLPTTEEENILKEELD